jgi:hypothetical protein
MQVLPFVFSLILVFFFLTSRLSSEERIDKKILSSCYLVHKNRLNLVNKAEACKVKTLRKALSQAQIEEGEKKVLKKSYRPKSSYDDSHKLSLSFFLKNSDELTFQFAKKKLFDILGHFYQEKLSPELFDAMITGFITQKPKRLCNLDLSNDLLRHKFFLLLTDRQNPLEELLTVETFKDQALCNFFFLRHDLFEALFSYRTESYLEKEYKLRCDLKSFVLVKERVLPHLITICPEWTTVYFDQLLCFQAPSKKHIKATCGTQKNEFFYMPIEEANGL